MSLTILIGPSGTAQAIYSESLSLSALGRLSIRRASHVEPTPDGQWTADLSPVAGPILGPFRLRSQALAAELHWLHNWLGGRAGQSSTSPALLSRTEQSHVSHNHLQESTKHERTSQVE